MALHFKQVVIVGVGLIGGSLGMVLKRQALAGSVVGIGRRVKNLKAAVELGAIDRFTEDPAGAIPGSDLIVLATPVDSYERQLRTWGSSVTPGAIVTDVGSVKGPLVEQAEHLLPDGVHFVGAHPIAGKEKTGVVAGSVDLFRGARCIVTPTRRSDPQAVQAVRALWEAAGSAVLSMDPYVHDQVLGAVSHLPHVVAYSLMTALGDIRSAMLPEINLPAFGGGGLRDTTRIAASSPEMWRDIFIWNRENLVKMIETYERHIADFKVLVRNGDGHGLEEVMERAKELREQVQ